MQTAQIEYIEPIDDSSILRRRWALVGALVLLNVLDLMTTQAVLGQGGIERNPVMRPLVEEIWSGAVVKGACLALMALLLVRCPVTSRKPDVTLLAVCGWYAVVVVWNCNVLIRA